MKRTDPAEAEALLRAAGAPPMVPFPGRKDLPWLAVHDACGREIQPRLSNVGPDRSVCGHCGREERGARRKQGLAEAAVEVFRAAGWEPLAPYPGADQRWRARHVPCGTEREISLNAMRQQRRCAVCWRREEGHRVWDTESANAFMRSVGLSPLQAWSGSSTRSWRSRHDLCGREVSPRLSNLAAGQGPCAACGQEAAHRAMMLDKGVATEVMLGAGLQPISPYPGADRPWRSIHIDCGRECSPTLTNIRRGQGGCGPCGNQVLASLFRMPEERARQIMLANGLEPLAPYVNSRSPWRSRHTCGRVVSPTLGNAQRGYGICRYCNSSFPYDGPAVVYLVADANAVKIGIAAPTSDRIPQHVRLGWREVWRVLTESGDDAYTLEQAILVWWRDELQASPYYSGSAMPQDGASETVAWEVGTPSLVLAKVRALADEFLLTIEVRSSSDVDARPRYPAFNRRGRRGGHRIKVGPGDVALF